MAILLTGATGFIGGHLARALLAQNAHVRALVRPSRRDALEGVEVVTGDLTDRDSLRRAVAGCDVVFHCAADYRLYARDPGELYRNNVDGTRNLLQAAAEANVRRVVYTSSVGAVGAFVEMVGDYKRSKFLAEREVDAWVERGLPVVTVSPATTVGELDARPTPTGQIIVDFLNGRLPAYVDTGLNVIDVRDVAAGHLLAAERGRPGARYILANENVSFERLLGLLAQLSGLRAPRVRLPGWLPVAIAHLEARFGRWRTPRVPLEAARMARTRMFFDGGPAVRELGLPQSPIAPALRRAISWFVAHGYVRRPLPLPGEGTA
jgi:dihydroflavonol-4-reductase